MKNRLISRIIYKTSSWYSLINWDKYQVDNEINRYDEIQNKEYREKYKTHSSW